MRVEGKQLAQQENLFDKLLRPWKRGSRGRGRSEKAEEKQNEDEWNIKIDTRKNAHKHNCKHVVVRVQAN